MKPSLFLLLCLIGVPLPVQSARNEYYLITTPSTWDNAKAYCKSNFVDLAMLKTADDWYWLNAEVEDLGIKTPAWVGLYIDVITWYWSNLVVQVMDPALTYWGPGQPDNLGGNQRCCTINSGGFWADEDCELLKPYICYSGGSFFPYTTPMSNWESKLFCRAQHIDLAASNTSTQNNQLKQIAINQGTSWIGLYRDPWLWLDGNLAEPLPWGPGLPNNIEQDDNCGAINTSMTIDRKCKSLFHFFCYKTNTVKYQVVKLTIRGDNSVFDPAVQSVIFQQIVQKLLDHGIMRKTTVTWRVHPDGNIFHKKVIKIL